MIWLWRWWSMRRGRDLPEDPEKESMKAQAFEFSRRAQALARRLEARTDELNRELGHG